jgi:NADH dehydrogenase
MQAYSPNFHGVMVCVGSRWAGVCGHAQAQFGLVSFFAMFSKHFVNMIYFVKSWAGQRVIAHEHEFLHAQQPFLVGGIFQQDAQLLLCRCACGWARFGC